MVFSRVAVLLLPAVVVGLKQRKFKVLDVHDAQGEARQRLEAARESEARHAARSNLKRVGGAAPVPPLSEPNQSTPIILEVSAFADGWRCALTLYRAFAKATHPRRVSFHLLQAREDSDLDCLRAFKDEHLPKICKEGGAMAVAEGVSGEVCQRRVLERSHAWLLNPKDGEGPAHQRGVSTSLLQFHREDAMCLSSDSHMDFAQGWDEVMLADWASTRNEFAVLSVYPMDVGAAPGPHGTYVDLCGYYLEDGIPRGRTGGSMVPEPNTAPYLTVNWAAGLSFHRCHAERNVPVDWHLRWIFTGEEIDRALRMFTSGYDIYLPTNIAVTHNYSHASQKFHNYGGRDEPAWHAKSKERLQRMFADGSVKERGQRRRAAGAGGLQGSTNFGVGTQRSVEDFVRWGRVNLGGKWKDWLAQQGSSEMSESESHSFCKRLTRVPVDDEVELVASIGTKTDEFVPDGESKVRFYGDEEELNVKKIL